MSISSINSIYPSIAYAPTAPTAPAAPSAPSSPTSYAAVAAAATAAAATTNNGSTVTTGGVDTLNSGGNGVMGLSSDDFMKLFLAQLKNQDPTKPQDDSQMLAELSQMTQVSALQNLEKTLSGSALSNASSLIGKNVTGVDVNGKAVDGVVKSVTQSSDAGLVLQVGDQYIKPDAVVVVTNPK